MGAFPDVAGAAVAEDARTIGHATGAVSVFWLVFSPMLFREHLSHSLSFLIVILLCGNQDWAVRADNPAVGHNPPMPFTVPKYVDDLPDFQYPATTSASDSKRGR